MNLRTLILLLFGVWCVICWRWYVCGIKEACGPVVEATAQPVAPVPAPEPDSSALAATSQPEMSTSRSNPNAAKLKKIDPNDISSVQMEEVEDKVVIHFPYNSVRRVDSDAIDAYLSRLATYLIASGSKIYVGGHTDFVSSTPNNKRLGLGRAQAIRSSLVKKGVNRKQIIIHSYGESKPVGSNDTPQGRYMNRRAEIRVTD